MSQLYNNYESITFSDFILLHEVTREHELSTQYVRTVVSTSKIRRGDVSNFISLEIENTTA